MICKLLQKEKKLRSRNIPVFRPFYFRFLLSKERCWYLVLGHGDGMAMFIFHPEIIIPIITFSFHTKFWIWNENCQIPDNSRTSYLAFALSLIFSCSFLGFLFVDAVYDNSSKCIYNFQSSFLLCCWSSIGPLVKWFWLLINI